jgi:hypothetical protein
MDGRMRIILLEQHTLFMYEIANCSQYGPIVFALYHVLIPLPIISRTPPRNHFGPWMNDASASTQAPASHDHSCSNVRLARRDSAVAKYGVLGALHQRQGVLPVEDVGVVR